MGNQTDTLPHHQCEHRRQTQQRTKREVTVIDCGRSEAAEYSDRYTEQRQGAECPAAEHRLRQQEHQHRRRRHVAVYRPQGSSLFLVFAEHLGTVLERECDLLDAPGDIIRHITKRPLVHFRGNIDTTRGPLSLDDAGGRRDADVRNLSQANLGPALAVDHQIPHVIDVVAQLRAPPDNHVENLLVLEQRTDGDAADHRGGRPADVARLQAVTRPRDRYPP